MKDYCPKCMVTIISPFNTPYCPQCGSMLERSPHTIHLKDNPVRHTPAVDTFKTSTEAQTCAAIIDSNGGKCSIAVEKDVLTEEQLNAIEGIRIDNNRKIEGEKSGAWRPSSLAHWYEIKIIEGLLFNIDSLLSKHLPKPIALTEEERKVISELKEYLTGKFGYYSVRYSFLKSLEQVIDRISPQDKKQSSKETLSEPLYNGHITCLKCGKTHWMYGDCITGQTP